MSKERLSKFAMKYIDWDMIINQIVKEARSKTKTTWGLQKIGSTSGESTSTQIKKMNFSEVKQLVQTVTDKIINKLNNELNQKLALYLPLSQKGRIFMVAVYTCWVEMYMRT